MSKWRALSCSMEKNLKFYFIDYNILWLYLLSFNNMHFKRWRDIDTDLGKNLKNMKYIFRRIFVASHIFMFNFS